jgi:oligopeptide/dipeptide ABC transporter ATP-binding protein
MALINDAAVLLADEPTTGLDVTIEAEILALIRDLSTSQGLGVLLVTHDLAVAAHYADQTAVMFAGRVVDVGPTASVLGDRAHPYTQFLMERALLNPRTAPLDEAAIPPAEEWAIGCAYRDRCPLADSVCSTVSPPDMDVSPGHRVHCHYPLVRMPDAS